MTSLLRIREVLSRTGMSRATIYRLIAKADFPAPLKPAGPGSRMSAWRSDAIDLWIESRQSE